MPQLCGYALIGTCLLQGMDPRQYLREVVGRLDEPARRRRFGSSGSTGGPVAEAPGRHKTGAVGRLRSNDRGVHSADLRALATRPGRQPSEAAVARLDHRLGGRSTMYAAPLFVGAGFTILLRVCV